MAAEAVRADADALQERVLLLAPTRRDAEITCRLLAEAGLHCQPLRDARALAAAMADGAGALLLSDLALSDPDMDALVAALGQQPAWSDMPVLVMTPARELAADAARVLQRLGNVTLLDRPASLRSVRSAVQASLRARRRQYQLREQIAAQERTAQALREGERRKDEFLATLAHELRNPLAPIRTGVDALARLPGDSPQADRLRAMMARQVDQLVKLIDELLDVSRIATGKVVLRQAPVDLRTVVAAALEACQPALQAAQHRVSTRLPAHAVWVLGDASRLAQVLGNLVGNAAKYTPPGGQVELTLAQDGEEALLLVADNGVGIPPAMVDRVFDLFAQVDRTLDRAQGGLGIGLALVRSLVELHGGSVQAASDGLDRGSRFTVRLPLTVPQTDAPQARRAGAQAAPRRLRVLVVDDNTDAADALAIQLEARGHATRTAYGAVEGLALLDDFAPQIVFCDVGMPGMDGHAFAARLRADPRHADRVLVALTGWGADDDKRRTRRAGFDHHLVKPASWQAIEALLATL